MSYDPDIHHRRSIRLKDYDYSQSGGYFVTVCTEGRSCLLGDVSDGAVQLSGAGLMVEAIWREMPAHYAGVLLDAYVVMPNHIHGIVVLTDVDHALGLGDILHRFKSLTTARYRRCVLDLGWKPFCGRLWQRNYYEHIIRDEHDLEDIREYIETNSGRWSEDKENPAGP